jgi:photosystem II stability/assembly factor-like uncharacterized protein
MTTYGSVSKVSMDTLSAIARFRHQHRSNRGWLVGGKRISSAVITRLEQKSLVKEVAFGGEPTLILTEDGKKLLGEHPPR